MLNSQTAVDKHVSITIKKIVILSQFQIDLFYDIGFCGITVSRSTRGINIHRNNRLSEP